MIQIVRNPYDLVYDAGVITRVEKDGLQDVIKVINQDNVTWYVETPDRAQWTIVEVDSLPEDWEPKLYSYDGFVWTKVGPNPSGYTENNI